MNKIKRTNILETNRKTLSQDVLVCNMKALILLKNNETAERSYHQEYSCEIFPKIGQSPRSRSQGNTTRNTHVKYQNSSTYCSKVISKVKVSEKDLITDSTKTI